MITVFEAEKIETEMRREEKLELQVIKMNMWRKWRRKSKILERENRES